MSSWIGVEGAIFGEGSSDLSRKNMLNRSKPSVQQAFETIRLITFNISLQYTTMLPGYIVTMTTMLHDMLNELVRMRDAADNLTSTQHRCTELINEVRDLRVRRNALYAALLTVSKWDCLNPPQAWLCSDFPWLKELVEKALMDDANKEYA